MGNCGKGKEWVELYNSGENELSLKGFMLDDYSTSAAPTTNAFILDEAVSIEPQGYILITIPEESFSLGNSGSDSIRLFGPDKKLIAEVPYAKAPENQSYSKGKDGKWEFGLLTPGKENENNVPEYDLVITEVLPKPDPEDDEFVEIQNLGTVDVPLNHLVLVLGTRKVGLEAEGVIRPGERYIAYADEFGFALRNTGQKLELRDSFGRNLSAMQYPKAILGKSYAFTGSSYSWTEAVTPGDANVFVLGAAEPVSVAPKTPSLKTPSKPVAAKEVVTAQEALEPDPETLVMEPEEVKVVQADSPQENSIGPGLVKDGEPVPAKKVGYGYLAVSGVSLLILVGIVIVFFMRRGLKRPGIDE